VTDPSIVRVVNVSRYFKRGTERVNVLNSLDLVVPEGQFLALMGPSGSGKTTLLNLIAGLDTPSEGEIWVGDRCVSKMNEAQLARWRNAHVGFVFQFYHLLPVLSAYENVELPLLLLPLTARKRREQVMTALELVGLKDRNSHLPSQLSGGQQQRVALARALVMEPQILLLDEPLSNLDANLRVELRSEIKSIHRTLKMTVIHVTHDSIEAEDLATRIISMSEGRITSS